MAIKALMCPQCGANLSLDDSRDFGFCQYCGAKVMLHEVIEVRHTGTVRIDTSGQEENYLKLANAAYSAANFEEAYSYYAKTLEVNSNNIIAIYLKGVSAVLASTPPALRSSEFVQGAAEAWRMAAGDENNEKVMAELEEYALGMVDFWLELGIPRQPASKEMGACQAEYAKAVSVASLVKSAASSVKREDIKEKMIQTGQVFLKKAQSVKLSYIAGHHADRRGRLAAESKNMAMRPDQIKAMNEVRDYLKGLARSKHARHAQR